MLFCTMYSTINQETIRLINKKQCRIKTTYIAFYFYLKGKESKKYYCIIINVLRILKE